MLRKPNGKRRPNMPAYFYLDKGKQPDSVVIDDGVAPFELTRDELKNCIAQLKANPQRFTPHEYKTLMHAYRSALAFLDKES